MIDNRAFEPDLVDFFRELVNLRVGRVAEEKRDVSVGADADDLADFGFEFALRVSIVVTQL